jgi:hypothetical protein
MLGLDKGDFMDKLNLIDALEIMQQDVITRSIDDYAVLGYTINIIKNLEILRELVWNEDIPSPCCPEYREHHDSIQKILKFIDNEIIKGVLK